MLLFYKSISIERKHKDFLFLILAILVLQFQYYDAVLWAAAATAAVCPVFFSFSSFYFLSRPKYFWPGLIAALLYVASNTVGFFVLIMGLILLIQKKNHKGFFIWMAVSLLTCTLYFYNFFIDREHHLSFFGQGFDFSKILFCIKYSFIFLGGSMQFFNNTAAPATIGILLWIVFFYLTYKKYYLKNPPIYYLLAFLLSISFLVPFFRYQSNMQTPLVIRYSFFSIMAISSSIISMAELINKEKRKKLFLPVLLFALIYHFSANIFFLPEAVLRKDKMISEMEKFKYAKEPMHSVDINNTDAKSMKELNAEILQKSIEKKIYEIPE